MTAKIDLTGKVFGRLTVLYESPVGSKQLKWRCICECGTQVDVYGHHLRRPKSGTKSCGCLVVETSRAKALRNNIGGYKGYTKYDGLDSYLANTTRNGDCLEWAGATYRNGYAKFPKNTRIASELGHRAVFMMVQGYLPQTVMHTCDNPKCINPQHLLPGTPKLNNQDRVLKKRDLHLRRLTENQVLDIRKALAAGESASAIGNRFSVSKQSILAIKHRRTWSYL